MPQTIQISSCVVPSFTILYKDEDAYLQTESALAKLLANGRGNYLLQQINNLTTNGRSLKIVADKNTNNITTPRLTRFQMATLNINPNDQNMMRTAAHELCKKPGGHLKNEGTSATVYFNPMKSTFVDHRGTPRRENNTDHNQFDLAHELIHAKRRMKGNYQGGDMRNFDPVDKPLQALEEYRAIGVGPYADRFISENSIRQSSGLTERKYITVIEEGR